MKGCDPKYYLKITGYRNMPVTIGQEKGPKYYLKITGYRNLSTLMIMI